MYQGAGIFSRDESILYRETDEHGRIIDVKPVTVVEDSDIQIVVWLPLNTPSKKAELISHTPGTPRRWTKNNWALKDSTWQWAELLIVVNPHQQWATWVRWSREREFLGWYVNMQSELTRTRLGFDLRDHQLDILVEPNREWRWKNEDELELCMLDGRVSAEDAEAIYAEGQRAVEEIEQNLGPFSAGWEDWHPDPKLPRPTLSPDWDDLSMYS